MNSSFWRRARAVGLMLVGFYIVVTYPWGAPFADQLSGSARLFVGACLIYGGWQYMRGKW